MNETIQPLDSRDCPTHQGVAVYGRLAGITDSSSCQVYVLDAFHSHYFG